MGNTLAPKQFFGSSHADFDGAGFTLALRRAIIPPEAVPEHSHEGAHLVLAIDAGYVSAAINNRARNAPMTLVYNPPGTLHRDRFTHDQCRFLSIDIDADLVPSGIIDPIIVDSSAARFNAGRIAGFMSADLPDRVELEDVVLSIVTQLKVQSVSNGPMPDWLVRGREAMADLADDSGLQIRQIADAAGVHPVHFARVHQSHFGCSPGTSLRHHRLAQAAAIMSETTDLAQVAVQAGFTDQSHMTRAFRRDYATTPARFRDAFG